MNLRSFSFFSSNKSVRQYVWDTFNYYYEYMFPTWMKNISGFHHPELPRVIEDPFFGSAVKLMSKDGLGLTRLIQELGRLSQTTPRGIAYCNMLHVPTLLLADPKVITQALLFNGDKLSRGKMIPVFSHIVEENVFSREADAQWAEERKELESAVFALPALKALMDPMQKIIDGRIDQLKKDGKVPDLSQFTTPFAMDSIGITLASVLLKEHAQDISKAFERAMEEISNPLNEVRERLAKTFFGAILEYFFNYKINANIDDEKIALQDSLEEHFLEPNIDETGHCSFQDNPNLVKANFPEGADFYESFQSAVGKIAITLLAGHETTSNLLRSCFLVLFKHPDVLENVRKEIDQYRPENGVWTRDNLMKMTYLGKVVKETLRLYPPFPLFPREVTKELILADIPFCATQESYDEAMAKRDVTKDIVLPPGTALMIAPIVTHYLDSVFENPKEFIPERYKTSMESFGFTPGSTIGGKQLEFLIPFSLGQRKCLGPRFVAQEVMLIIANIMGMFDIKASIVPDNNSDHINILDTYIHNTLKQKGTVEAQFTLRQ